MADNKTENLVSKPPLQVKLIDQNGLMNRAWSVWFRDLYRRVAYKGGNSIDENIEDIDDLIAVVEQNIIAIAENKEAIELNAEGIAQNAEDIAANTEAIIQNTLAIAENAEDIADNAAAIAQNITNIANNAQAILDLEYRVLGDTRPGIYQASGVSYSQGDYIVNPSSNPQKYFSAREDIPEPAGPFDSSKWGEVSLKTIRQTIVDELVYAAYGSIGLNAPVTIGTITAGTWVDLPMDFVVLGDPKDVSYDLSSNGMTMDVIGVWSSSIKAAFTFDDVNAGRQLRLRFFDITDSLGGTIEFVEGIGRNTDAGGFSFVVPFEVSELTVGHKYKLQITGNANFTNVESIGSIWYLKHDSEAKFI